MNRLVGKSRCLLNSSLFSHLSCSFTNTRTPIIAARSFIARTKTNNIMTNITTNKFFTKRFYTNPLHKRQLNKQPKIPQSIYVLLDLTFFLSFYVLVPYYIVLYVSEYFNKTDHVKSFLFAYMSLMIIVLIFFINP